MVRPSRDQMWEPIVKTPDGNGIGIAPMNNLESAQFASEQIRRAIILGQFKASDRLIEKQLSELLNVSRHPVRDALRLLEREGFVEIIRNRGATVRAVEAHDIVEVYKVRIALGRIALDHLLGAGTAGPEPVLSRLETLARKAVDLADLPDQSDTVRNDLEFQQEIINATGLHRTMRYFSELTGDVRRFNNLLGVVYTDRSGDARKYVYALYDAIRDGNLEVAQAIRSTKFSKALERYLSLIANSAADGVSKGRI